MFGHAKGHLPRILARESGGPHGDCVGFSALSTRLKSELKTLRLAPVRSVVIESGSLCLRRGMNEVAQQRN
jgi:hypothetical protein